MKAVVESSCGAIIEETFPRVILYTVFPLKIYCLKESIQGVETRTNLIQLQESSILLFHICTHTLLELNDLCPRPNSLYAFIQAIDLQWDYTVYTATKIPLMYSFSGNSEASAPISTFMCL
jgi:hypothetical protein